MIKKDKILKYIALTLTILCLILICFFSFKKPSTNAVRYTINDKLLHCVAYFCLSISLTLFAQFVTKHKKSFFIVCLFLSIGMGFTIEMVQPYFNHICDMLDLIADILGSIVGCVAAMRLYPILSQDR